MRIKLLIIAVCMATVCFAKTINVNQTYNHYVELTLFSNVSNASSITITGNVRLNSDTSLVRILLIDNVGEEYMLFESYSMIVDTNAYSFSNYADETKYLHNIKPQSLRIYAEDASVYLQSIYVNTNTSTSTLEQTEILRYNYYKSMNQLKIAKLNFQISKRSMRWTAGETDWGNMFFKEKRSYFGGNNDYNSYGFEYQIDGVYALPHRWKSPLTKTDPTLVYEYDIRNLHNALNSTSPYYNPNSSNGWITPKKNQLWPTCGSCWAFAAVAMVEGVVNFHFNKHIDLDLSEQHVLSCTPKYWWINSQGDPILVNSCSGGFTSDALDFISSNGVIEESIAPYQASDIPCASLNIGSSQELIKVNVLSTNDILSYRKKALVSKGSLGASTATHAMAAVGWRNYSDGSVVWILKDSNPQNEAGLRYVDNGSLSDFIEISYKSSLNYSESDRVCVDMDGDGYYNWGIGTKPSTCPDCAPDTPDGNDADPTIGPVNEYGQPILPFTPLSITDTEVTTSQTWSNDTIICGDLVIKNNATLTLTGSISMQASHRIYIKNGAKMIINGGSTSLAGITVESGGTLTLNGNGTIEIFNPADVTINVGGLFYHNYGKINVVNPFMPN